MKLVAQCANGVGLCFIPHPRNDHRPWALRHPTLALLSALLIFTKIAAITVAALIPVPAQLSTITVDRIEQLTNDQRQKNGLSTLTVSPQLTAAAQQKGQDMLKNDYFAHISPAGVTPWYWMGKVGYTYTVAGENLAIDFTQAEDVFNAWLASPSHKANLMLPDYTEQGVAVVTGEFEGGTSTIVVHMFGHPSGAPAAVVKGVTSSPTPTATPTPSTAPHTAPTPPDTPRTPRIAREVTGPSTAFAALTVEGSPHSIVHFLVNGSAAQQQETLPDSGRAAYVLNLDTVADGPISVEAYAQNGDQKSDLSTTLSFTKDTTGPVIDAHDITFVVSPVTDQPQLAVAIPSLPDTTSSLPPGWHSFDPANPPTLSFSDKAGNTQKLPDLNLTPVFTAPEVAGASHAATYVDSVTHQFELLVFALVTIALVLSIAIKIRVQHPVLIAHSVVVLVLAGVLFFL